VTSQYGHDAISML